MYNINFSVSTQRNAPVHNDKYRSEFVFLRRHGVVRTLKKGHARC